jgi:hypothetical protein
MAVRGSLRKWRRGVCEFRRAGNRVIMLRIRLLSVVLSVLAFANCNKATDDEQLIRQFLSGGKLDRVSSTIHRKYKGRWGDFYFVRNVDLENSRDTAIGLVGVTTQSGRRFAFLAAVWTMSDMGGIEYSQMIRTDSLRYIVGPGEWWNDSAFWSQSIPDLKDTVNVYFAP